MRLSIIAALSSNNVIGRNNDIPWRQSTDLKRLKALTMGHHLIMGRKTYESVGRPLPGRTTVVITRQSDYAPEGVTVVQTLEDALRVAREAGDVEPFIAGGAEIFALAMHRADRMYLTRVHANIVDGDTFFPHVSEDEWEEVERSATHPADARHRYPFTFITYERRARTRS